jgi:hypothetical protein
LLGERFMRSWMLSFPLLASASLFACNGAHEPGSFTGPRAPDGDPALYEQGPLMPLSLAVEGDRAFFSAVDPGDASQGAIFELGLATGDMVTLAPYQGLAWSVAADATHVYWLRIEPDPAVMAVTRAGGAPITLAPLADRAESLSIDATHLYWTEGRGVMRMPKAGGAVQAVWSGAGSAGAGADARGYAMAIDEHDIFWVAQLDRVALLRVSKQGGKATILADDLAGADRFGKDGLAFRLAVDDTHVYFSEYESGSVNRVSKQGGQVTTLSSGEIGAYALIVREDRVYWTNPPSQAVLSVPAAGGAAEALPIPDGMSPWALAADSTGIFVTDHAYDGAIVHIESGE